MTAYGQQQCSWLRHWCNQACLLLPQDEFSEVFRFSAPVFPSEDDDVVTSPYNAALAASCLVNSASCVLPVENQALTNITGRLEAAAGKGTIAANSSLGGPNTAGAAGKAWDAVNGIAASLLLHLTSSVRFQGMLNTDLNDITMNLVSKPLISV